tara:strand:+ start:77 stop:1036 length:960 start_codon:yes stop_codon:yes gene_type:complete
MFISKCPVRISLAGGSTDLDAYLQKYNTGSVICFSANIYCYINLNTDKLGLNGLDNKYVINYMKREVVSSAEDIKNDIARLVFQYFNMPPTTAWFTSDIYSSGSGLASSTAYLIAMISAVQRSLGIASTNFELCQLASQLEKKFNPLTGYQDPFGCGVGGFNKFTFAQGKAPLVEKLPAGFLEEYDMYLINTGLARSSTEILKTIDPDKCTYLADIVSEMHTKILNCRYHEVIGLINEGWNQKKKTSKLIMGNNKLVELDEILCNHNSILAHRLLGAGNGGYFLAFVEKHASVDKLQFKINKKMIKIRLCSNGPTVSHV